MCILIHHDASTVFGPELLADFYSHNSDGFGLMYGDGNKIHIHKTLGSLEEITQLYQTVGIGRECIMHFRMQTHGDIDINNCHPYMVTDDIYVAHNGVLTAGNPINKTMSDTWHMIEYLIRPVALTNPDMIFSKEWIEYMSELIGTSNKLAFCHADGRIAITNYDYGVKHEGSWLSNTYAWSAAKHGLVKTAYTPWKGDYDYSYTYGGYNPSIGTGWKNEQSKKSSILLPTNQDQLALTAEELDLEKENKRYNIRKVERAAFNCYQRGRNTLLDWVLTTPDKASFLLRTYYNWYDEDLEDLVNTDPDYAADCIAEIFDRETLQPFNF